MNRSPFRSLRSSAFALTAALLFGCGGGSGTSPTTGQSESVQAVDTPSKVTITASGTTSDSTKSVVLQQWSASQFAFNANVKTAAGGTQSLAGTLLLKGEAEGGTTEVEGRLLVNATPAASATGTTVDTTAVQAALTDFRTKADALRAAFRADVRPLIDKLRADLAAASDATQRMAAKDAFTTAFKALNEKFQQDFAALIAALHDQLAALGINNVSDLRHASEKSGDGRNGFKVSGTMSADGAVSLTITLGKGQVIQATGQTDANGNLSGTFTGPNSGDTGTWTASQSSTAAPTPPTPASSPASSPTPTPTPVPVPVPVTPAPTPTPAPVGNVASGQTLYASDCAGCHNNPASVRNGATVAGLDAAINAVGSMRSLAGLSAQNKLDIAAFIATK